MLFPDSCYRIHELKSCDFTRQALTDPTLGVTAGKGVYLHIQGSGGRSMVRSPALAASNPPKLFHWQKCLSVKS